MLAADKDIIDKTLYTQYPISSLYIIMRDDTRWVGKLYDYQLLKGL